MKNRAPASCEPHNERQAREYRRFADVAKKLDADLHYELDEKEQHVTLTDAGLVEVEAETGITNIYDEAL